MKQHRFSKTLLILWIFLIVSVLSTFCLSILLIRAKQHIIQHGYRISQLEVSCEAYRTKINELDKEIIKRSNVSTTIRNNPNWIKEPTVHHIKKRDVQYFAFNRRLRGNRTIAGVLKKKF